MAVTGWKQRMGRWSRRAALAAACAGVGTGFEPAVRADDLPSESYFVTPVLAGRALGADVVEISAEDAEEAARSEYWVGVQLNDVPELAKVQLRLDYGLAVVATMPDSPALKAGLQIHDILLKAGERELREPIELVRAVNEAKEKPIKLVYLRQGKEQSVEVTPEKRPQAPDDPVARVWAFQDGAPAPEVAQLEQALRTLQSSRSGDQPLGLWFVRPPIFSHGGGAASIKPLELPSDVTVTVEKRGAQPARVTVRRGDRIWEAAEGKLEAIPAEFRDAVERMTGRPPAIRIQAAQIMPGGDARLASPLTIGPTTGATPTPVFPSVDPALSGRLDRLLKRLEQLDRPGPLDQLRQDVDRLRKEVDALQKKTSDGESKSE